MSTLTCDIEICCLELFDVALLLKFESDTGGIIISYILCVTQHKFPHSCVCAFFSLRVRDERDVLSTVCIRSWQ